MNIPGFFDNNENNKKELIEALEFYYFLHEIYYYLLEKQENSDNKFILDFLKVVGNYYNWQYYKIKNYSQALYDHIFWKSSEFYLKSMRKFVACELSGSEFVDMILYKIINDRRRASLLQKDFKKQSILELNSNHYQFRKIISDLEFVLEAFDEEPEEDDVDYVTEDDLRGAVKRALVEVEKYFND